MPVLLVAAVAVLRAAVRRSSSPPSLSREELLALYQLHVDEYRFQVKLNAQRTQYFLALNTASLAAGSALLGRPVPRLLTASVFAAGMALAAFATLVTTTGHAYYRAARQGVQALEGALEASPHVLLTTPGMRTPRGRGRQRRWARWPPRVIDATVGAFVTLVVLNLVGFAYSAWAGSTTPGGLLPL